MRTIIIGAGPAGLSAALNLEKRNILIEKEKSVGGLGRSREVGFFIFDYAGHIFFTKDIYASNLFADLLGDNHHYQDRSSWVFSNGVYTGYPFQSNLCGLPRKVIDECVEGLKRAIEAPKTVPLNFDEWITATFGTGIAEHFMRPYNQKVWARPLTRMDYSWIGDRVQVPSLEEVEAGAKSSRPDPYGPNSTFGYPLRGGCQALMDAFIPRLEKTDIMLQTELWEVDAANRGITLSSGKSLGYDHLLSSIPLPALVKKIVDAPDDILKMAERLEHTSVHCVNLGLDRENLTDKNWIYYPAEDIIFQRLFIQSNASPHVCPEGTSSVTAEISYSEHKQIDHENIIDRVIHDMLKTGIIDEEEEIMVTDHVDIDYGYIVFDKNREECLMGIKAFLEQSNIIPIGRFGEWNYFNMDHAFLSGKVAAERVNAEAD